MHFLVYATPRRHFQKRRAILSTPLYEASLDTPGNARSNCHAQTRVLVDMYGPRLIQSRMRAIGDPGPTCVPFSRSVNVGL